MHVDQLFLPIFAEPDFAASDFREAPSNTAAYAWIHRTAEWPNQRLALWGEAGRGKTRLLHIWAELTGATICAGCTLTGLADPPRAGVAIDEADTVPEETALLHLLNATAEAGLPVLLAARTPPARWPVQLPDLASRLRAITAVEIGPPEDTLLQQVLARLFAARHLRPPEELSAWLVLRLPRSAAALQEAVVRLNAAALEQQRRITIPFAAAVLADLLAPDEFSATAGSHSPDGCTAR